MIDSPPPPPPFPFCNLSRRLLLPHTIWHFLFICPYLFICPQLICFMSITGHPRTLTKKEKKGARRYASASGRGEERRRGVAPAILTVLNKIHSKWSKVMLISCCSLILAPHTCGIKMIRLQSDGAWPHDIKGVVTLKTQSGRFLAFTWCPNLSVNQRTYSTTLQVGMRKQAEGKLLIWSLLEMVSYTSEAKSPAKLMHFKRKSGVFADGMNCCLFLHLSQGWKGPRMQWSWCTSCTSPMGITGASTGYRQCWIFFIFSPRPGYRVLLSVPEWSSSSCLDWPHAWVRGGGD